MQYSSVEDTYFPKKKSIRIKDKLIDLSTPIVMGIVNCTPDSFYISSRASENEAITKIEQMISEGALMIDIGGYSSRPGAKQISISEEISRIESVFEKSTKLFPEVIFSIDTFRSEVAKVALDNGANLINDISGFEIDPNIANLAAEFKVPYILMHMKGTPQNMQQNISYKNLFGDITKYFSNKIDLLKNKGVHDIIIDPGFGFSKTIDQNYELLNHLDSFSFLNTPILVGLSRKSMIYNKLGVSPEESLEGTIALNAIALSKGASILRVHDVKEAVQLIKLIN